MLSMVASLVLSHIHSYDTSTCLPGAYSQTMILLEGSEHGIKACITPPTGSGGKKLNWHEWSTAGNDIVATIIISLFFFSPHFFCPPLRPFLIEGVLVSKYLFSKRCLERPKAYW